MPSWASPATSTRRGALAVGSPSAAAAALVVVRAADSGGDLERAGHRLGGDRGGGGAGDLLEALDRGARLAGAEHVLYGDFVFSVGLGALFYSTSRWLGSRYLGSRR
jgi:hypothetical protein